MTTPFRTVFAIYEGMTHLDFTGPHQFLRQLPGSETIVASMEGGTVSADGLHFANTIKLEEIVDCDLICVPGGMNATRIALNDKYLHELRRLGKTAKYVTSVCTGSLILGAAGLLTGRRAACHWASRDLLSAFGAIPDRARVVRDGNVITGGGVTAGIDFALTIIAEIAGERTARAIQLGMEYAPCPPFSSGSPETAEKEVVALYSAAVNKLTQTRTMEVLEAAAKL